MSREWKPKSGDVGMLRFCDSDGPEFVGIATTPNGNWRTEEHGAIREVVALRPLVVIDPESAKDVARLADAFCTERWSHIEGSDECDPLTRSSMQAALREFANPTPPKPEEPTGLGAVVKDVDGMRWVRWKLMERKPWRLDYGVDTDGHGGTYAYYAHVNAVRVLSEGVPE